MKIKIISDSACDLNEQYIKENDISIIPFYITIDDEKSYKDKIDIQSEELIRNMRQDEGFFAKTSQPSPEDYQIVFERYAKENLPMLCFTITKQLSGSYQSANIAKKLVEEKYDCDIRIIDTQSASLAQALLINHAIKMMNEGKTLDEIVEAVEEIKHTSEIFISLDTLKYLEKGGRISKTTRIIGNALKLKPILKLEEGKLEIMDKVIGKKKAIKKLIATVEDKIKHSPQDYELFIVHADELEIATQIYDELKKTYNFTFQPQSISPVLASHAGYGALALGMVKTK